MALKIGVLALQGAFQKHCQMLEKIGAIASEVRYLKQLKHCDGLIIPGGESTVMLHFPEFSLKDFDKPIFGTCAGMILMAHFGLLDITLERNAYGRQFHSFAIDLTLFLEKSHTMHAIFIRAPRIVSLNAKNIQVLARYQNAAVAICQGKFLATSFHPELTNDPIIHHTFLKICEKEKQSPQQPLKITPTKSSQTI